MLKDLLERVKEATGHDFNIVEKVREKLTQSGGFERRKIGKNQLAYRKSGNIIHDVGKTKKGAFCIPCGRYADHVVENLCPYHYSDN